MKDKQWVQHISGTGQKWEVSHEYEERWEISHQKMTWLPKSEYRLCDPPEVWQDVTGDCEYQDKTPWKAGIYRDGQGITVRDGYRLRKVRLSEIDRPCEAFIVEKLVSQ